MTKEQQAAYDTLLKGLQQKLLSVSRALDDTPYESPKYDELTASLTRITESLAKLDDVGNTLRG
ncbi:hypothetical protein [Cupriavidus basilensis]|uniref:Uncharacterized protein n=1 Tax=Cupriavidus basilensis TaxID=68895 RepID=A0A643FT98_9BURK|nr:hypothetical protein [Cupriavidus basilensis]QOT82203.1 hypothetical protein F7R26_039520 [Cupriavidus basilensis]